MAFEKLKARWEREREEAGKRSDGLRNRLVERGRSVFDHYGVRRVVLFGSVLEGRSTERSDIDLLVIPLPAEHYWSFRHDLEEALDVAVDVYTDADDHRFVQKILEGGETIYVAQR